MAIENTPSASLGINLRHLRAFLAVAAAGSIAAAAEQLYRVTSAVARSISELEDSLGRQLFDRRSRLSATLRITHHWMRGLSHDR